ncbi:MAG TPA: hypothetical protein VKE49_10920 [Myxococcaceae bacterium]|nr:hypothetical protein [Myxococcaceae bacterium]
MSGEERQSIEAGLVRMQAAIARSRQRQQAMLEQWIEKGGAFASRREQRRFERQVRRQAYTERRRQRSGGAGAVYLVIAAVIAYIALSGPDERWWMLFIALGLALTGMKRLARSQKKSEPAQEAEQTPVVSTQAEKAKPAVAALSAADPSLARIDELCERLLSEVRRGPEVLRDVVRRPEETVKALKDGCHALAERERELRALITPEDDARLLREREQLLKRLEAERDEVTKQRLKGALDALEEQRKQRSELLTAASRMEAERTRLRYTLENLYTQVLRVRSADASSAEVAGNGLRQSVERLGDEIGALAEALESVHSPQSDSSGESAPPASVQAPISDPSGPEGQAPRGTRERV